MTPPLRFLGVVIGGWTAARALVLAWPHEPVPKHVRAGTPATVESLSDRPRLSARAIPDDHNVAEVRALRAYRSSQPQPTNSDVRLADRETQAERAMVSRAIELSRSAATNWAHPDYGFILSPAPNRQVASSLKDSHRLGSRVTPLASLSRWSGSAWVLAREGGENSLGAGSSLVGASQAGARLLYRVAGTSDAPLSLTGRVSSPLRSRGAEAAVGVEWQPVAGVPVRLLAERRERVAGEGRSAFALLAHGGVSALPVAAGFKLDGYAQAGVVGARRRDLFADGGATLTRVLGGTDDRLAVGAGAWGGVQPGAARLDLGPRVSATVGAGARVSVDWRFRIAGDAAPGSGPSITVATDF